MLLQVGYLLLSEFISWKRNKFCFCTCIFTHEIQMALFLGKYFYFVIEAKLFMSFLWYSTYNEQIICKIIFNISEM